MARWRLCLSKVRSAIVHRTEIEIKHQGTDALSQIPTDGADTNPIEENITIAYIDATSSNNYGVTFQRLRYQAITYVAEDNNNVQEGSIYTFAFEEFLQQQATDAFSQQAVACAGEVNAEYAFGKSGPVFRKAPIDGANQIFVPTAHRERLPYQ